LRISVIGAGGWGTAIAELLGKKGFEVLLWVHGEETLKAFEDLKENTFYLKGIKIEHIKRFTKDIHDAIDFGEILVLAVPAQKLRSVIQKSGCNKEKLVLNLAKGIEMKSFKRMSQVIIEEWHIPKENIFTLSGPNFSFEIASEMPAATVIGGTDENILKELQNILSTNYFRVYYSLDLPGVELGGSLKNVYAIACGVSDGLGFGDSSKASLIIRSLAELVRLGVALGGRRETFFGLSGSGDLIATAFSRRSRNRRAGEEIGRKMTKEEVEKETREVIEGIYTLKSVYDLDASLAIELPIIFSLYRIVYEKAEPGRELLSLMLRPFKEEKFLSFE
jgi:glycerol-3-phosphate dehydrogenase (NAD(P)+)